MVTTATANRPLPSRAEVLGYLKDDVNWGRWEADDQKGAVNLVDDAKRLRAAAKCGNIIQTDSANGADNYARR